MNDEITELEEKIAELVARYDTLRAENQMLRTEVEAARSWHVRLYDQNREATRQIQSIIDNLQNIAQQ